MTGAVCVSRVAGDRGAGCWLLGCSCSDEATVEEAARWDRHRQRGIGLGGLDLHCQGQEPPAAGKCCVATFAIQLVAVVEKLCRTQWTFSSTAVSLIDHAAGSYC